MTEARRASPAMQIFALLAAFALATTLAALVFAGLMRAGAFGFLSVMFYRGLVALGATGVVVLVAMSALLRRAGALGLSARDAVGATLVALALNLAFFTLGPVTVDRSISVFMLSRFESAGGPMSERAARDAFVSTYVDEWRQIDRRLGEQVASGNLERTEGGWRITPQGRAFMATARAMSRWFGGDPRFVGR